MFRPNPSTIAEKSVKTNEEKKKTNASYLIFVNLKFSPHFRHSNVSTNCRCRPKNYLTSQPCFANGQGFGNVSNIFSAKRHRTSPRTWRQIGQFVSLDLQVPQMRCPLPHWKIGGESGTSRQTGHSINCSTDDLALESDATLSDILTLLKNEMHLTLWTCQLLGMGVMGIK